MRQSVSVFGLGYVGTVTAACLAHKGHKVIGVDLSPAKVEAIRAGRSPVVEPRVGDLISQSHAEQHLHATSDSEYAVLNSDISFLCVGTPSLRNGKLDLGHIEPVCREIGRALQKKNSFHLVVLRSTVLPGTAETIVVPTLEKASAKKMGKDFGVCVNPEFMREGTAVSDFLEPSMTIIGAEDAAHSSMLRELYDWVPGRIFETSFRSAEMVKYVCNAWHAVKVAFANEVGTLAKELGVDAEAVVEIFTADNKLNISPYYLKPGFAFGGSCLPKDLRAMNYKAKELDVEVPVLSSILPSNRLQVERAVEMVLRTGKKRVGVLGFSFKAGTDDLRESPMVNLIETLLGKGLQLSIYDRDVLLARLFGANKDYIEREIPHVSQLMRSSIEEVLESSEIIVLGNKAEEFRQIESKLKDNQIIIDLVRLFDKRLTNESYQGICW